MSGRRIGETVPAFDAVVIGSGYGGGVAASRLARMGYRIAVLEQGHSWRPGEFPTTGKARRKTTRLTGRAPKIGDPAGLYYLSVGKGVTVFGASGVGGGSLINAGIVLRPDVDRLRKLGWPAAVTTDGLLMQGLARAERMLGVAPAPDPDRFPKVAGMRRLAEAAGRPLRLPAMTIAHVPGDNISGVAQADCRHCGDCWSGCNAGAKSTVGITYLADAVNRGATVLTESRARSIAKTPTGWRVAVDDLRHAGASRTLEAPIVVLAAGTLGTTELLLRAQAAGLPLSTKLGANFSANGDDMVIATGLPKAVHAVATGYPSQAPDGVPPVGPHSIAVIDLGDEDGPVWVHDGTMLTMMAALAPVNDILRLNLRGAWRQLRDGIYGNEMSRVQLLYVVSHDDARGQLRLRGDHVVVDWPGYSETPALARAERKVKAVIERMGGEFNSNPFSMTAFGGNRIIAHPLGGCVMAETAATGVVDPAGRVFDPTQGPTGVHDGLYVCDGAAVPTAIGVSPLLTITALAERTMMLAARRLQRPLDVESAPVPAPREAMI